MPMTRHTPHHRSREQGFTLVVIAALFLAFAVIAAAAIERNTTLQLITRRDATAAQLTKLSNAIIEYSVFNKSGSQNRYPCPAKLGIVVGADLGSDGIADFGAEVVNCYSTATDLTVLGTDVIRGMVPVLALSQYGINTNDAFDPWNNRIMYIVNRTQTYSASGPAGNNTNNPTIVDARTNAPIPRPDFILISYGRDGIGGHKNLSTASHTTPTIACSAASTMLREENCDNDTDFRISPTYTAANATTANYFDDILTWYRQ